MEFSVVYHVMMPVTSEAVKLPADSNQAQGIGQYAKDREGLACESFPHLDYPRFIWDIWDSFEDHFVKY